ncbi:GPCR, family 2-like,Somatomedin B domain,GPCR, family 2, secretin-like [Cinara cedri]|uniref:GPCR, family 2-like,Somatomedin B domain,GPCR, family 2, secretin-like n=1 Tax=Cinara cedri TaxID=506608 RepID=A0A5E4MJV0_9HEMI|nr:GPCR, family 2-like,Somatomedin B domain,GPCR, family 2, secretin-like [Cinara cedri]
MKANIRIHFIITIFIWLVSWTASIEIPHSYLENPSKICPPDSSCKHVQPESPVARWIGYSVKYKQWRNCMCDHDCQTYGDCCTDYPYFDPVKQQRAAAQHVCVEIDSAAAETSAATESMADASNGAQALAKCPATWSDRWIQDACETPPRVGKAYGMIDNPVTSRLTGRVYRNRFCAVCNGDAADTVLSATKIVCDDLIDVDSELEHSKVLDTLRYNDTTGRWAVQYANYTYDCAIKTVLPAISAIRPCITGTVGTCHPKWPKDDNIRSDCEAYTTVVYKGIETYKNPHCAMCNHVAVQNLTCKGLLDLRAAPHLFSFSALFIVQPDARKCRGRSDKFFDPFSKTCQPLVPVSDGVPLNCSAMAVYVTVPTANWQPPDTVDYVMLNNGSMAVCENATSSIVANITDKSVQSDASEAFHSALVTYVGLGVSAVFLIVHLAVFAALPSLRNLSGKNLASFCVSLIGSYAAFVAGNLWPAGPGSGCYAIAALTYYSFLTSFAWMLIMSFDCWRTLRLATSELRITTGRQTKKFLVYSAVCWLVPAMMTVVAVTVDTVPAAAAAVIGADVRPEFGTDDHCWFGNTDALLVFFVSPLCAVMAVNFMLFVWTAYMIHSSRATVRHVNTRHVRRNFRMYCRLAVLMGLTWSTGIAARFTDSKYLWILFVALNTFQGLFVFAAFTCRRRILDSLLGGGHRDGGHVNHLHSLQGSEKGIINDKNQRVAIPSFSWSSSDHSAAGPVSSEKTSDTLY